MHRTLFMAFVLLAIATVILAGCGGSDGTLDSGSNGSIGGTGNTGGTGGTVAHGPRPHGNRGACINCHPWSV